MLPATTRVVWSGPAATICCTPSRWTSRLTNGTLTARIPLYSPADELGDRVRTLRRSGADPSGAKFADVDRDHDLGAAGHRMVGDVGAHRQELVELVARPVVDRDHEAVTRAGRRRRPPPSTPAAARAWTTRTARGGRAPRSAGRRRGPRCASRPCRAGRRSRGRCRRCAPGAPGSRARRRRRSGSPWRSRRTAGAGSAWTMLSASMWVPCTSTGPDTFTSALSAIGSSASTPSTSSPVLAFHIWAARRAGDVELRRHREEPPVLRWDRRIPSGPA